MEKCRLCAQDAIDSINVVGLQSLIDNIAIFTSITIHKNDDLTTHLCKACNNTITTIDEFRKKCIEVQVLLRNEISNESFSENDNIDWDRSSCSPQTQQQNNMADQITKPKAVDPECDILNTEDLQKELKDNKEIYKSKYQASLHPCDTCGKKIQKNRFESHRNRHLDIKPYVCPDETCGQAFYSASLLKVHNRDRHTSHVYECEICGKTYKVQKSYYTHKERHKTPSHACTLCDKRYKSSTHLKQHMRIHTGERPYSCTFCDRSFAALYNFKAHLRSHTKEKPFSCDYCNAAYGYRNLLKHHMNKSHPEIIR